jgi:pyridoxal phosphate enzyme (YggS family)
MSDQIAPRRTRLAANLKRVQQRIAAACVRAGRQPDEVRLVAVTKTVGETVVGELIGLGQHDLAESRTQELVDRAAWCREQGLSHGPGRPEVRWHLVGHLQRNKVRAVLPWTSIIHSVDSLRLAEEIDNQARRQGRVVDILLQINSSGERTKFGVAVGAASHLIEQFMTLPGLRLLGLMTMAPLVDEPERARPVFSRLREVFEDLCSERLAGPDFRELSMGMSNDFEVAVEEGATLVRVGTALFEGMAQLAE